MLYIFLFLCTVLVYNICTNVECTLEAILDSSRRVILNKEIEEGLIEYDTMNETT